MKKYILLFVLCVLGAGCGTTSGPIAQEITVVNDVRLCSPIKARYFLPLSWKKNPETDLMQYNVYWGTESRNYSYVYHIAANTEIDTAVNIPIPAEMGLDSVFCAVTAMDLAENESDFSNEVVTIPEVYFLDFSDDDKKRIDIDDRRKFIELYKKHFAKTTWKNNKDQGQ